MADHFRDATKKVDFISREAALACVCQDCSERKDCLSPCVDYCRIKDIPAADVRPVVRAHWIETAPINEETGTPFFVKGPHLKCSNCGSIEFQRNFCPNCGADMREPNLDTTKGDNHD